MSKTWHWQDIDRQERPQYPQYSEWFNGSGYELNYSELTAKEKQIIFMKKEMSSKKEGKGIKKKIEIEK